MSASEVTAYIKAQDPVKAKTLEAMRKILLEIEPKLEQTIAWKSAMFKFNDKFVVGLCAHKAHLSFSLPSSELLRTFSKDLKGFVLSKNSFQFESDQVLDKKLVSKLVKARLAEIKATK
jgi:uncharacterized protein YdhG (YjbR/CyaY superfamily)